MINDEEVEKGVEEEQDRVENGHPVGTHGQGPNSNAMPHILEKSLFLVYHNIITYNKRKIVRVLYPYINPKFSRKMVSVLSVRSSKPSKSNPNKLEHGDVTVD
jgi:hypothetical protein